MSESAVVIDSQGCIGRGLRLAVDVAEGGHIFNEEPIIISPDTLNYKEDMLRQTLQCGCRDPVDGNRWTCCLKGPRCSCSAASASGVVGLFNAYLGATMEVRSAVMELAEYKTLSDVYCFGDEVQRHHAVMAFAVRDSGILGVSAEMVAPCCGKEVYVQSAMHGFCIDHFGVCGRWVEEAGEWRVDINNFDEDDSDIDVEAIGIGAKVKIQGLQAAAQLNGEIGKVISCGLELGRWRVELPTREIKSVKAENLKLLGRDETSPVIYVKPENLIPSSLLKLVRRFRCYPLPIGCRVGLFPRGCFVNHSCEPNCVPFVKGNAVGWMPIKSLSTGQYLNFNYVFNEPHAAVRSPVFRHSFGFSCKCDFCLSARASESDEPSAPPAAKLRR